MPTEALKKFAAELKQNREEKEVTLQFISNRTKIDVKYLLAIENGDFEILPDVYIRAFIKGYVQLLDLNVQEVMNKFELAKRGKIEEKNESTIEDEKEKLEKKVEEKVIDKPIVQTESPSVPEKKNFIKKNLYSIGAFIVLVIVILVYFLFIKESSTEIITESSVTENNNTNLNRFEIDSSAIGDELKSAEDDSLKLSLTASARVWVKIIRDKKEVFQSFVDKDKSISYKASKEFRVVVGNAGFISISLNNKPLELVGSRGEIRNYIINADTVKSYLISVPAKNENKPTTQN